jgi:hypothetical protein
MNTGLKNRDDIVSRLSELLVVFLTVVGLLLILGSYLIPTGGTQEIIRSIGLNLFPAGVVAFLLARFASNVTELLLTKTVDESIRNRLQQDMKSIEETVERGLVEIDEDMKKLAPLFISSSKLGLENLYLTRTEALEHFAWFLDAEAVKAKRGEPARVWFVSSSIKGFVEAAVVNFNGRTMMERIAQSGCEIRILMTDPKVADLRAKQEGRADSDIPNEIRMNLANLKRIGVKRESVRFYSGTPTVFAIATGDRMLLNPYPYQTEAFRCFSLVVYKTLNPDADIYNQYLRFHFIEPWEQASEVTPQVWNSL